MLRQGRLASEARRRFAEVATTPKARPQRQTASISKEQEHAGNDVRSQDAEQCEESDARYLLSLTFAATTSNEILMT